MADERRRQLTRALKLMSLVAFAAVVYVLLRVAASQPPTKPTAAPIHFDIQTMSVGESRMLDWSGRPILIIHRSAATLASLRRDNPALSDPDSRHSQQPEAATNPYRAVRPEWFVVLPRGTGAGCPLEQLSADAHVPVAPWNGGFRDPCDQSLYDAAGRVYSGFPAARNLTVPPHRYNGTTLSIGP